MAYKRPKSLLYVVLTLLCASGAMAQATRTISGKVVDDMGDPLPRVNVYVSNKKVRTMTDLKGVYKIQLESNKEHTLFFSYIGMKIESVKIPKGSEDLVRDVTLRVNELEEVVVTSIYTRKAESFSGSSKTYTAKELKNVRSRGLLESLKTLDPSFGITESNIMGSDPKTP